MTRREARLGVVAALVLVAVGCSWTGGEEVEATGRLAFVVEDESSTAIYVINADGTGRRQLTFPRSRHDNIGAIAWSPQGTKVAYSGGLGGWNDTAYDDLFVVNADGSGARRLTRSREDDRNPAWSPDGRSIAFDRNDDGYNWVYVIASDGTGLRRLTTNFNWLLAWASDGTIALLDRAGIGIVNDGGSDKHLLARAGVSVTGYNDPSPLAYSPDRRRLVFAAAGNLWVMKADGTARTKLVSPSRGGADSPRWSPDGRMIAFEGGDGDLEIFVINADGTDLRNLTDNRFRDSAPVWSPDSRTLAFASERDEQSDIYLVDVASRAERNLTDSAPNERNPAWAP